MRALRYRDTVLANLVYSFALSLLANYVLVYALVGLGAYRAVVLDGVMLAEWAAIAALLWRDGFRAPLRWSPAPKLAPGDRWLVPILMAFSIASILVFVGMWVADLGNVFFLGDDVISWDGWAIVWSKGTTPSTEYYPELLPANWSWTYVVMGTTDVKLFAKAIMPLFSLGTLLLFLDRFAKTRRVCWLAGLNAYALILFHFWDQRFLTGGYADIPVGFAAFLTFIAFLEARRRGAADSVALLLPLIFAAESLVVKQGGVFVFAIAAIWWARLLWERRGSYGTRKTAAIIAWGVSAVVVIAWWWIVKEWRVATGREAPAVVTLMRVTGHAPDYATRIRSALHQLIAQRAAVYLPYGIGVLLAAGLFHRLARAVLAFFVAPFFVIYGLFFSYEPRSFALAIPFVALCAGGGFETLHALWRRCTAWSWLRAALLGLAALAALVLVVKLRRVALDPWAEDVLNRWPPFLLCGAALTAAAIVRRREIAFRVPVAPFALATALALGYLHATSLAPGALVAKQLELQRTSIGNRDLSRKLYAYFASAPLQGGIATNYWYLGCLPELRDHYVSTMFPAAIEPPLMERLILRSGVNYFLVVDTALTPAAREWMAERGFQVAFTENGYSFIPVPQQAAGLLRSAQHD